MSRWMVLSGILFCCFFQGTAYSAQIAVVKGFNVPIYSNPSFNSPVIETLKTKTPIKASTNKKNGFYHVIIPSGKIGWLYETYFSNDPALIAPYLAEEAKKKRLKKLKKIREMHAEMKILLGATLVNDASFNQTYGVSLTSQAGQVGFVFLIPFSYRFGLLLRAEYLTNQFYIFYGAFNTSIKVQVTSIPTMLGFQYWFMKSESFRMGIEGYGGFAWNTRLSSVAEKLGGPNTTIYQDRPLTFLGNMHAEFDVSQSWFFAGELGYRYLKTRKMTPFLAGSGQEVFDVNRDGDIERFSFSLSGPEFGIGMGYKF